MTEILTEWTDRPFGHAAVAPAVGPFPERPFLETWWDHHRNSDQLAIAAGSEGTLPLRQSGGVVKFVGNADLTDYHSPLGDVDDAVGVAARAFPGASFSLNSLPAEAARPLQAALEGGGHEVVVADDAIAAVVDLSADLWLRALPKKHRHEIRRKQRRFDAELGPWTLERHSDGEAVARFAELHRDASGAKGTFMTPAMQAYFVDLTHRADAVVDLLIAGGEPVAAAFGFPRPDGYYLYNSGYRLELSSSSPGIVLLAALIDQLAAEGAPRLDLLKGDERYKFQLGAVRRPLYRLQGRFA